MSPSRWIIVLLALALVACRGPRDPDLDRRIDEARHAPPTEATTPSEAPPASAASAPANAPPKGSVERRTYSDDDIRGIMAAIEGTGPTVGVTIETEAGTIECTLAPEAAPQTVANFVALVTGQRPWRDPDTGELLKTPFYNGLSFHRTIANYIIQTGNPGVGSGGPGWQIPREAGVVGAYDTPGAMGMVDAGDDSHGSQFFIVLRPSKSLVGRYTPFGSCANLDVVRAIADAEKLPAEEGKSATKPKDPVLVKRVTVKRK